MAIHLTPAMVNDRNTLCGLSPGKALTQLLWSYKVRPGATCPVCLKVYKSAAPAFDAMLRLPEDGFPFDLGIDDEENE